MWTIIARSEIGTGVQLDPEVMASLWPYHGIVTMLHRDILPTDHVGEEVGSSLVGDMMQGTKVR